MTERYMIDLQMHKIPSLLDFITLLILAPTQNMPYICNGEELSLAQLG